MIQIRSPADLKRSRLPDPLHRVAARILQTIITAHGATYNPEDDGYLVVITPTDTDLSLSERLGSRWQESLFEGVSYSGEDCSWHVIYLHNNQYTMSLLIADAEWLDPGIRQRILQATGGK